MSTKAKVVAYALAAFWLFGVWQSLFTFRQYLPWILISDFMAAIFYYISWMALFGAEYVKWKRESK